LNSAKQNGTKPFNHSPHLCVWEKRDGGCVFLCLFETAKKTTWEWGI